LTELLPWALRVDEVDVLPTVAEPLPEFVAATESWVLDVVVVVPVVVPAVFELDAEQELPPEPLQPPTAVEFAVVPVVEVPVVEVVPVVLVAPVVAVVAAPLIRDWAKAEPPARASATAAEMQRGFRLRMENSPFRSS